MRTVSLFWAGLFFSSALYANTPSSSVSSSAVTVERLAAQKAYLQTLNQCNSPKRLSQLMIKALSQTENESAKAKHASVFEEIMLNNPSCAVLALNKMPAKKCAQFEEQFIRETYFVRRDQIKESLSRAASTDKLCVAL